MYDNQAKVPSAVLYRPFQLKCHLKKYGSISHLSSSEYGNIFVDHYLFSNFRVEFELPVNSSAHPVLNINISKNIMNFSVSKII